MNCFGLFRSAIRLSLLTSCACPVAALAQETSEPAGTEQPADEGAYEEMGAIVVTAQRREENLRDIPIAITAQSGEDLIKAGVTNLRDLDVAVAGLNMTATGPFLQPSIRGVTASILGPGAEVPVAVYIDGVYQPGQASNFFDLPDIERVEVLKGPQGTLFGRNATGGAISVITKKPSFQTTGDFSISDGVYLGKNVKSANEISASGFLSGPLAGDVVAASVSGFYSYTPGYLTNDVDGSRDGKIKSTLLRAKLLFEPSDTLSLLLTGYVAQRTDNSNLVTALDGNTIAAQYPDSVVPEKPWHIATESADGVPYYKAKNHGVSAKIEWTPGDFGTFTSISAFSYSNAKVYAEIDGAYSPSCVAVFACITPYKVDYGPTKAFSQEINFTSSQFGPVSFVAGLFFFDEDADFAFGVNPVLTNGEYSLENSPFYAFSAVETRAYAGYGEVNFDATDRLRIIAGLRYSWERKIGTGSFFDGPSFDLGGKPSWDALTPRISVLYEVDDRLNVFATYSKGFKSGVLNALSLTQDVAEPEDLNAYELGLKFANRTASVNLSGFYYDYKDLQNQSFEGLFTVIGNAASSEIYGLDLDASIMPVEGLKFRLAGSWLAKAEFKTFDTGVAYALPQTPAGMTQVQVDASGKPLLRTPKLSGNATISYSWLLDSGSIDASTTLTYASNQSYDLLYRINTGKITMVNAQIGYTPDNGGLRFRIWGKNLTNESQIIATTTSNQADTVVWNTPRQIGATIGYSF